MRKVLFALMLLLWSCFTLQAQDIRGFFMEAPDSVLPLLPRNARADCIDFADAGMEYPVANLLDGKCVMKEISDDYLLLQTSGISTMQMKLLPFGDKRVICVINTVFAESADSRVAFFDNKWNRLETDAFFRAPSIRDFFFDEEECIKVIDLCDIYLVALELAKEGNTLVAEYTMPRYMNIDDASKVAPVLRKLVYRWNGVRFVME